MKRGVLLAAAVIAIPGALVVLGLVKAWRYVFHDADDTVKGETLLRIRGEAERAERLWEVDQIPRGRRSILDGPRPTRALSRPWGAH